MPLHARDLFAAPIGRIISRRGTSTSGQRAGWRIARVHLLTEREILEGDRPVSPADQADGSKEYEQRGQHQ